MTNNLFIEGSTKAPILVIAEPPEEDAHATQRAMTTSERKFFLSIAREYGFSSEDFSYIPCSAPMGEGVVGDKAEGEHLANDRAEFLRLVRRCRPGMIITLGKHATRQVAGRAVQIGKLRGQIHEFPDVNVPTVPLWGVKQCLWFPENTALLATDFNMVSMLEQGDFDPECLERATEENTDYKWSLDLTELIDRAPRWLAVDTETTGLKWIDPHVKVLTVQLTPRTGESWVVPVDMRAAKAVYPDTPVRDLRRMVNRAKGQVRRLLRDPTVKKIGANFKFDHHQIRETLGYDVVGWTLDTQQLAFAVDENMREKSLDEVTRRWVPQMAGYADHFNSTVDKANMLGLLQEDPDKFLRYAGGDTDANFRGARTLLALLKEDEQQFRTYMYVQLPTLQAFGQRVEKTGMVVDRERLGELQVEITQSTIETQNRVLSQMSKKLRRKHLKGGLSLTRSMLVIDAVFGEDGLNLEPLEWTKSTRHLPIPERTPSVSAKTHLVYHQHEPLVRGIMDWGKLEKMRTTYVGMEHDPDKNCATGFWQHLRFVDRLWRIYPTFFLHRTITGRSASQDPNAQNFPKRGELAKKFRSIFPAPPGWVLMEADLSQAEIRIAACEAMEETMIRLYNEGVDIHMNTAAAVSGNDVALFNANKRCEDLLMDRANEFKGSGDFLRKLGGNERQSATVADFIARLRYQAKAINFGFLYGMQWQGFKTYAKIEYGVEYSDAEAMRARDDFFEAYPCLKEWHYRVEREVYDQGFVRSIHGALRRVPSIYSTKRSVRSEAVRQAINSPVQRFASDLGLMALYRLSRDAPDWIRPIAFIHDALVMYVREDMVDEAASNVKWIMENNPLEALFGVRLPLPIISDVSVGRRLSEMEEMDDVVAIRPEWHNQAADEAGVYELDDLEIAA